MYYVTKESLANFAIGFRKLNVGVGKRPEFRPCFTIQVLNILGNIMFLTHDFRHDSHVSITGFGLSLAS